MFQAVARILSLIATPAATAASYLSVWAQRQAKPIYAFRSDKEWKPFQGALFGRRVAYWAANASTTITALGQGFTITGTHTAQALNSTDSLGQSTRNRFVSATTSNAGAGLRGDAALWWRGNNTTRGGFFHVVTFGFQAQANTTGTRAFVGLAALTTLATAGEPSALIDMVGIGWDAADAGTGNIFFMHNDGTGTATKVDLGASFVRQNGARYTLSLYAPASTSEVFYHLQIHGNTGTVASGSVTTNLPTNTVALCTHCEVGTAASAAAIAVEIAEIYTEQLN